MTAEEAERFLESLLTDIADRKTRAQAVSNAETRWRGLTTFTDPRALDVLTDWLRARVELIGARRVFVGVSGGVDSSLVAVLLARAVPGRAHALLMPCHSDPDDAADALRLLELLGLPCTMVPLEGAVRALLELTTLPRTGDPLVVGNLVSRVRAAMLYLFANAHDGIVVGTGDMDETYVGYSSKGTTADLFPITGLHKDEVRALLHLALRPLDEAFADRMARRPASPGYFRGQDAEAELGVRYSEIARALDVITRTCSVTEHGVFPRDRAAFVAAVVEEEVSEAVMRQVVGLMTRNFHKAFESPALWRPEVWRSRS